MERKHVIDAVGGILTFLIHGMHPVRWHWFYSRTTLRFPTCPDPRMLCCESAKYGYDWHSESINDVSFSGRSTECSAVGFGRRPIGSSLCLWEWKKSDRVFRGFQCYLESIRNNGKFREMLYRKVIWYYFVHSFEISNFRCSYEEHG